MDAVQVEQSKNPDLVSKEPVCRILRRRIQKKDQYSVFKNMRFGKWKPVSEDRPSTTQPAPTEPTQEESMTGSEALPKKNAERKKHLKVKTVLKESVGVTKITKRILDLDISWTIGELLASASGVEKQLTKALSEEEVVQFRVNSLGVAAVSETSPKCQCYTMGYPKTRVRVEKSAKVLALLDTDAEIDPMTKAVMEEAHLTMRSGPRL